MLKSRNP